MKSKPIEKNAANVIFKSEFKSAHQMSSAGKSFTSFVDYTDRDEAVELNKEKEIDNNKYKDFGGFIEYMDRDTATVVAANKNKLTANFDANKDHLTKDDVKLLKNNLTKAQANNSNIYSNIVSFSTKFLMENNIYDPEINNLDQAAIRNIVRGSMKEYIAATPLKNPIWWSDIHVNTEHVHVHIGMAEVKPTTKKVQVGDHYEHRGKLPQAAFNVFKHQMIERSLKHGRSHELEDTLDLKKDISVLRQKSLDSLSEFENSKIQTLMIVLPQNKSLWRYGSNSKEMKDAKRVIKEILNEYKNQSSSYQSWLKTTQKFMKISQQNYGNNDGLEKRKKEMDNRLANRILKYCKNTSEKDLKLSVNSLAEDSSLNAIEINREQIKILNSKLKVLKTDVKNHQEVKQVVNEISKRKIALKKQFAKNKIDSLKDDLNKIKSFNTDNLGFKEKDNFKRVASFIEKEWHEKITLNELKQQMPWNLKQNDKEKLNHLRNKYVSAVDVPIDKVNDEMIQEAVHRNQILNKITYKSFFKDDKYKYLERFKRSLSIARSEQDLKILKLKLKMKNNKNKKIDNKQNYQKLKKLEHKANNNKNSEKYFQKINKYSKNFKIFKNFRMTGKSMVHSLDRFTDNLSNDLSNSIQKIATNDRKSKRLQNQMLNEQKREDREDER